MNKNTQQLLLLSLFILLAASLRIVGAQFHWYNIVPIVGIGIFSGSVLQNKSWAFLIPVSAMFLSDMVFAAFTHTQGFYGISQTVDYFAVGLVALLGTRLTHRSTLNVLGYAISGSLVFFLLSNFGTWLGGYYQYTVQGLIDCFAMAIPFYKSEFASTLFINSFLSNTLFIGLAFGIYQGLSVKHTTKLAA
jgi:hypothetical protein